LKNLNPIGLLARCKNPSTSLVTLEASATHDAKKTAGLDKNLTGRSQSLQAIEITSEIQHSWKFKHCHGKYV
jgi:hypothetical protein